MGRSFRKVPSIKPKTIVGNKSNLYVAFNFKSYKEIAEKFKKHCIKEYGKRI